MCLTEIAVLVVDNHFNKMSFFFSVLHSKRFLHILMTEDLEASLFILLILENLFKSNRWKYGYIFPFLCHTRKTVYERLQLSTGEIQMLWSVQRHF